MKQPRVSIAALMLGIAIAAFPFALLGSVLAGHPVLGLEYTLDMGVWPGVTALGIGLASIIVAAAGAGRSPWDSRSPAGRPSSPMSSAAACSPSS